IQNNVIINNRGLYGAGIVSNFAAGKIKNNVIYNNTGGADYGGAGIWAYASGITIIENNTIVGNVSEATGGGILIWSTSATVFNNIVWGNSSATGHSQIRVSGGSADITFCDIQDGWDGDGNINENPTFLGENLYLNIDSPCVDAGNPDTIYYDPPDPRIPYTAQWPSMGGYRNDMGAYGGPERSILPDFETQVGVDEQGNHNVLPGAINIVSNYPNPFNNFTTINYILSQRSHVKVRIYDMLGRQVNFAIDEIQLAGINYHTWNASDYPSGCYFYRISIDGRSQTKKMILLK
ncbi:MAG: T9SS type A sorting domain-containing protein, partial [candidate division Zixibacteria bacterium]|nr:T9SS type A sorting domain-containing protein [candidate division Zixibacteria bacterium]